MKKMKLIANLLITLILLLKMQAAFAGGPVFREMQNVKMPFTPTTHYYSHTGDFKFFLCSNKTDMLMFDGTNGKILWQKNFGKDYNNKRFLNQYWNKDANVILVYDEDTRKGVAIKYFIDGTTGKLLWQSDKYVSDFGKYELKDGFRFYYDPYTKGVLLPTKESVDFVDVTNGKTIWSKPFTLAGRSKDFDCYIMDYYDLVRIVTGKESEMFLTTLDGKEVTDIEPYFNMKKFLADRRHATIIDCPDKNMYVLMQGETNKLFQFLGVGTLPKWKMTFKGYNSKTNELLWTKKYTIAYFFDLISKEPYVDAYYMNGCIYIEHDPSLNPNTGLTVLNPVNGELMWETRFTTCESKNGLKKSVLTPFPAPSPVVVDNRVYIVNKDKNRVYCNDAFTGNQLWESEKFPDAQKIPTLIVSNGVVILGLGGDAVKCVSIAQSQGPPVNKHEYNNTDTYGIIAYDAGTGKVLWSNKTIKKAAKDAFSYISGMQLIDGKIYCATNKNFFILDPQTGSVQNSVTFSKQGAGDAWKMFYFNREKKVVLNCKKGIIKIDPVAMKVDGVVKTPTIPFYQASTLMNADDDYQDYAVFTKGNVKKWKLKTFASIDLDKMTIRGLEEGAMLLSDVEHFSDGAEMFFKVSGSNVKIYSVK